MKLHPMDSVIAFVLLFPLLVYGDNTASTCTEDIQDTDLNNPESCSTTSLFMQVENGLKNPKYNEKQIAYNSKPMPFPDFLPVFETHGDTGSYSIADLAKSARDVIDDNLPSSGAVLFRNLHHKIERASDFKEFWGGVRESEQKGNWTSLPYLTNAAPRGQLDGVDTADNHEAPKPLKPHNEMVYDPIPPTRIAFYCMQEGIGGQTLLTVNKEMSKLIPEEIKDVVRSHGGVEYYRYFKSDAESETPDFESWQAKTGSTTREGAIQYFVGRGWKEEDITFDDQGGVLLYFVHSGFIVDEETGEEVWFNGIANKNSRLVGGSRVSEKMRIKLMEVAMETTSSFLLKRGDWIVLDNFKVMHGRIQYKDISPETPRTLLVSYTHKL